MNIKLLKKELGIKNEEIAQMFGLAYSSYMNSSAKSRYENALCLFYDIVKNNDCKTEDHIKLIKSLEKSELVNNGASISSLFIHHVTINK